MPSRIPFHRPIAARCAKSVYEKERPRQEDKNFYSSARWMKLRAQYIATHPLCEKCQRALAQHVHHKEPRKVRPDLAFEWENLQALCIPCHNAEPDR